MTRRDFLSMPSAAWAASQHGIRRELFRASPRKGIAVMASAYYTRPQGGDMLSIEQRWSRSDTVDVAYYRYSRDHGRNWGPAVEHPMTERRSEGVFRRHPRGGWVDQSTGKFLEFWIEGVLPGDDPLEGLKRWNIYYGISDDGGRTHRLVRQVIHKGHEFDRSHPMPGVYTGKNAAMIGDITCRPLYLPDKSFLLAVSLFPMAPDGSLYNPGGGYTYSDVMLLHARWQHGELEWDMRARISGDPARSTRGMDEPTLQTLGDGRLLLVMRGSNDRKPDVASSRWVSFSSDAGHTWSPPAPWTYTTGDSFFSPSSCSQLVLHSRGKLFWLGNITPENPRGNRPRYPFVVAEVDQKKGMLVRDSVRTVDNRAPGEAPILSLSNFFAHEDRQTAEINLNMSRLFAFPDGWVGDAFLYRIPVA